MERCIFPLNLLYMLYNDLDLAILSTKLQNIGQKADQDLLDAFIICKYFKVLIIFYLLVNDVAMFESLLIWFHREVPEADLHLDLLFL